MQRNRNGKGHALWQLNQLANTDKHKMLVAAGSGFGSVDISETMRAQLMAMGQSRFAELVPPLFIRPADNQCPLKVGCELYTEPIDANPRPLILKPEDELFVPRPELKDKRQFRFHVAFNKPGVTNGEPAIKTLQDMANLVNQIITKLGGLLP